MIKLRHLRQAGGSVKNTSIFEASVGARILLEQTRQLSSVAPAGLEGPQQTNAAVAKALDARACDVARRIRFQGLRLGGRATLRSGPKARSWCGLALRQTGDFTCWSKSCSGLLRQGQRVRSGGWRSVIPCESTLAPALLWPARLTPNTRLPNLPFHLFAHPPCVQGRAAGAPPGRRPRERGLRMDGAGGRHAPRASPRAPLSAREKKARSRRPLRAVCMHCAHVKRLTSLVASVSVKSD